MPGFVVADYVVFAMSIVISLGIGIYYAFSGGRQKTTSEYLVGNRQLKILPVALSLMVSFESSIMMLGFPAETYVYGIMFWLSNFGFLFANLIAVRLVVPLVHPLKITSVYEYFELRFNAKYVRMFGTILGMLNYVFYMGIVLFGPGIALESVTNFPMWASILSVALAAVIYTSIGGIKAVIWTDVFQSVIMFAGIFAILIKGTMVAGGVANVIDINKKTGRLDVFDFNPDPTVRHTFWNLVVGSCIRMVGLNFNQSTIQRISSTPKRKDANKVLYFAGPAFFITLSLATLEGLVAFAYFYTKRCDPLASKEISNPNQVIPYMVLDMFQNFPGMPGLFMASLFSASLSTMSSGLSSLSALTVQDIVKPHYKNLSDATTTMIAKLSVIVFGAMSVGVSFMVAKIKGPMSQISFSVLSAFGGPMAGLFLYSIFCPWATAKGAFSGGFLGFIFMLWMSMGQNFSKSIIKTPWLELAPTDQCQSMMYTNFTNNYTTKAYTSAYDFTQLPEDLDVTTISSMAPTGPQGIDKMYTLSYQWFGTLGILVTIFIGTVTSLIEGRPDPKSIDVRYMLPFFDQFFPFLPKSLRKRLYCGTRYEKRKAFIKNIDKGYDSYEEEVAIGVKLKPLSNQKDIVRYDGMVLVKDGNNGVTASDEPVVSVEAEKGNDVATFMPSSTTEEENLETTKT